MTSNECTATPAWLSPWSRNLMLLVGYGLVVFSVVMIRNGIVSNDFTAIIEGVGVGFVGWLISTLVPDPVPDWPDATGASANADAAAITMNLDMIASFPDVIPLRRGQRGHGLNRRAV